MSVRALDGGAVLKGAEKFEALRDNGFVRRSGARSTRSDVSGLR
ncbi:hypothetical protein ACFV4N_22000 [Actinosynnema sp. NPDC059797]